MGNTIHIVAATLCAAGVLASSEAAALSAGCAAANTSGTLPSGNPGTFTTTTGQFDAGEAITVRLVDGDGGTFNVTSPNGSVVAVVPAGPGALTVLSFTVSPAVVGNLRIQGIVSADLDLNFTITCSAVGGSGPTGPQQNALNAQIAAANGLIVLNQSSDAIKLAIIGSFGGNNAGGGQAMAMARYVALQREELELANELADLTAPAGDPRRRELEARLQLAQRNVALAKGALAPAERNTATPMDKQDEGRRGAVALHVDLARALPDYCTPEGCAGFFGGGSAWNAWADGRGVGVRDSSAQQWGSGFVGLAGADYKPLPWLALGLSVGAEAFVTNLGPPGARISTNGLTLMPYLGVRLDPNIVFSGFVGVSRLNYSTAPLAGIAGSFESWRFMTGAALAGVWYEGPWRLQPSIDVAWGSENQGAYTNSAGVNVAAQLVQYGRVSGGPEIGYRFAAGEGWSVEPFVLARFNIDFAPSTALLFTGQQVALRGQGSGSLGAGVQVQGNGFSLRADMAYESLGAWGLEIWTARVRGGWSF